MDYLIEQPLTAGIIDQPQHSNPPPPVVRSSAEDPTSHSHVANARQNKPEEQDSAVPKAYRGLVKTYSDWRTCRPCSTAGRSVLFLSPVPQLADNFGSAKRVLLPTDARNVEISPSYAMSQ